MNFKQIMAAAIAGLRAAIRKMPLAEQFQANDEARWAINRMGELGAQLDLMFPVANGDATAMAEEFSRQYDAAVQAEVKAAVETAVVAAEAKFATHIPKEAHELALASAQDEAKKAGRDLALVEVAALAEAGKGRAALIAKGLPAAIADGIDAKMLVGAAAEAAVTMMEGRIATIRGLVDAPSDELFQACAEVLDAEGQAKFDKTIALAKSLVPNKSKVLGNPMDGGGSGEKPKIQRL